MVKVRGVPDPVLVGVTDEQHDLAVAALHQRLTLIQPVISQDPTALRTPAPWAPPADP